MSLSMDMEDICKIIVTAAGGAGAVVLTPTLLASLGFTSTGIAAGSLAAKLMAYFAVANGGGVAAGGLVAFLQSLGAGGFSGAGSVLTAGAGGAVGWLISTICNVTVISGE
ncbi:interferon alpha-inducible protein 27-like protein 2A [Scomber japonicus]|uniref:interferon alpha-inducible protein 27-like protein 2A n=1 Tax=Scomber japonicus TaxID=13676 RepID=UPI0023066873|nr:interferon alpha-inducible protein 27-like protein 2A [Scomber japonicus]